MLKTGVMEALKTHPCYDDSAYRKFARVHIPVAPKCNIQCNYCNRKYSCSNESRPGVTSRVLSPVEAVNLVKDVKRRIPELRVVAIAGPGDALANKESFEALDLVKKEFPEMTLCLSTNGLMLPGCACRLLKLGVNFVTVTVNAIDTSISERIYDYVIWNGEKLIGKAAAERLIENQIEGIEKCVELGMAVKINTVLIPGYNDTHIPELVNKVKKLGAYMVNVLPFIPVEGTKFSNIEAPTPDKRKEVMDLCCSDIKMMRHCRQCRADAIGFLDDDKSVEFMRDKFCGSSSELGNCFSMTSVSVKGESKIIAVASESNDVVDCGFGNTKVFRIYESKDGSIRFLRNVDVAYGGEVYGQSHIDHIRDVIIGLHECDVIIVKEIGSRPRSVLESKGKKVFVTSGSVMDAIRCTDIVDKNAL